jgi:hypothetical protein
MLITLTKEQVDACFDDKTHQAEALIGLYRMIYPDWDNIKKLHSFPKCGKPLNEYIFKKFQEFDRKNHPGVMRGGLWFNNGWSVYGNDYLGDWEVDPSKGEPEYV